MPAEAQRHRAEEGCDRPGQRQREQQAEPGRDALGGGQPGSGVSGDADKRGLAERGQPADAHEQDEAERHQRVDADVIEQRDGEAADEQRQDGERENAGTDHCVARRAAHVSISSSSSSTWPIVNDRHSKIGINRLNTATSLNELLQNEAKLSSMPTMMAPTAVSG